MGCLKDWPFYSGGGVGFVSIEGDFSAVDVQSETAQQATIVEMAVLNVDQVLIAPVD
jgi:hypothetical protein